MSDRRAIFDSIVNVCDNLGLEYRSYSGRCMHGKSCIGFITEKYVDDLIDFGMSMSDEYPDFCEEGKIDNMGRDSMIVYFPYVSWPDDFEMIEEED